MAKPDPDSRGEALARRLRDGVAHAGRSPLPGARDLPLLSGVTPACLFTQTQENVLALAARLLVADGHLYLYGNDVVYEICASGRRELRALARGGVVDRSAASLLANVFICQLAPPEKDPVQFPPPWAFVQLLLNSAAVRAALPVIRVYASRPLYDEHFRLRGPGWHADAGILVHGPDIEPVPLDEPDPDLPAAERLPLHLHALLAGFCFRDAADLANALGFLLTILLVDLFVSSGKPIALIDGNQPGLGKSLLGRVLGILMDGLDPALIHFASDDEELGKRICATLRGGQTVVLVDNAKLRGGESVDSRVIEANSMAPRIALRILGVSANYERPNDVIWALTMNDTKASPDLVSRGVPIRLSYDGDPRHRAFDGPDPIAYALERRAELLGELAGMVDRWNALGRPPGGPRHRCGAWTRTVGGVVAAAGFPEFLANLDDAAGSFNQSLDELMALAEAAFEAGGDAVHYTQTRSE